MAGLDTGQIVSALFLLLIAVIMLLAMGGRRWQGMMQQASIWALIFVVTIAGFGIWQDVQNDTAPRQSAFVDQGRIEVPRHPDGHYYLRAEVNGAPIDFVVDTGATDIVLTMEDARRAGLDIDQLRFFGRANTANGTVRTAPVRLEEIDLGGIVDRGLPASVNEGEMFQSLMGMSYLQQWGRIEIANGMLVLTR